MKVTTILMKLNLVLYLCKEGHLPVEAGIWAKSTIELLKPIQLAMDRMEPDGIAVPNDDQAITLKSIDSVVMKWLGPDEIEKLFDLVVLFDDYFGNTENVLHFDWSHTRACISPLYRDEFISQSGTFLYPGVEDEYNNWGSRGRLLDSYFKLRRRW